jgi:pyrroline-5-carboxylate reductase
MNDTNALSNCRLAFIGCGVMAEAIVAGLLRKQLVSPEQIAGSHPRTARRQELHAKYGIQMFEDNKEAAQAVHPAGADSGSVLVLAVKPQRLRRVLQELKGSIHAEHTRADR